MKMRLKMSSVKWRPFCAGGDELKETRNTKLPTYGKIKSAPVVVSTYVVSVVLPIHIFWDYRGLRLSHQHSLLAYQYDSNTQANHLFTNGFWYARFDCA